MCALKRKNVLAFTCSAREMPTALHAAAENGYLEIVQLLLKKVENPCFLDQQGRTAN